MDRFDHLHLLAELDSEHCQLNHGPGVDTRQIAATDYLVLPVGYDESADCDVVTREMVIPVCFDCIQALQGEEWTLLYCLDCGESQWVKRQIAKNRYRHHVLWMKGCPECGGKFGGLYFNDFSGESQVQQQPVLHQLAQFVLGEMSR